MLKILTKFGAAAVVASFISMVPLAHQAEAITRGKPVAGGLTCQFFFKKIHFHKGRSRYQVTKQAAMQAAIARWVRFTVWEYGSAWGNYRIARYKSHNCWPTKHRPGWKCHVKAQPCRY